MGLWESKEEAPSIPILLKQLNAYHLPEDRNNVLDLLEEIDRHLVDPKTFEAKLRQLKDTDAVYHILKITKKMIEGNFLEVDKSKLSC